MTISMYNILSVTNRLLCTDNFLKRIENIAKCSISGIILREKDLSREEYKTLATDVIKICEKYDTPLILHSFFDVAQELNYKKIHLPLHVFKSMSKDDKSFFDTIGVSCHSVEDSLEVQQLGADYITLGHIFETDCKKGLAPRGINLLNEVCAKTSIPVFAIGGIAPKNITSVVDAGANGACIMSGLMKCSNPKEYLSKF